MKIIKGFILKGVGGRYTVKTKTGLFICEIRGNIKKTDDRPIVGDFVKLDVINEEKKLGMINEILPRKTKLFRPLVSNVSQAVIVFSIIDPVPHFHLLDRLLVFIEYTGLKPVICFNKVDIEGVESILKYKNRYENIGYQVIIASAMDEIGREELIEALNDEISVFAGPSGVGKSSLLNMIQPNLKLKTGEISQKIRRGKHTTRHTELIELDTGGWVVDTPGFANLDVSFFDKHEVGDYFPEIKKASQSCKFSDCLHISEPKCQVLKDIVQGDISRKRYESYLIILNEIEENRRF